MSISQVVAASRPRGLRHIPVIGVGGPVGSGKTALVEALCRRLRDHVSLAVVTNDIFTKEDAEFLTRRGALPQDRILGVETGGCPHTAIREDASHNQEALDDLLKRHPDVESDVCRERRRQSGCDIQPGTCGQESSM